MKGLRGLPLYRAPRSLRRAALRGFGVWRRLSNRQAEPIALKAWTTPSGPLYLDALESPMMLARILGLYEEDKFREIERRLSAGMTFLDVGANKGDFALFAARRVGRSGRVLAFEPEPNNVRWIHKSQAMAGLEIDLQAIALADVQGTATLHLGAKSGWHSLVEGLEARNMGQLEVPTSTLDAVLAERGWPDVHLMKIDVEGAELAVLRGARKTFARNPGLLVMLDFHPELNVAFSELHALACELHLQVFEPKPPYAVVPAPNQADSAGKGNGLKEFLLTRKRPADD